MCDEYASIYVLAKQFNNQWVNNKFRHFEQCILLSIGDIDDLRKNAVTPVH